ncbi:MAG: hypothetical protein PHW04_03810 [Candidatus Wallbacteria bacterium]|nr:hypothetical protein [Candidatus Wallbacteria bacterium]
MPIEAAVKVRMYELLGEDTEAYRTGKSEKINLMFEWTQPTIPEFSSLLSDPRQLNRN